MVGQGWRRRSCWRLRLCCPWHHVDDGSDYRGCIARRDCVAARVPVSARSCHVRPQVDERDDASVAVERACGGIGWLRICRHGLEKIMHSFPPSGADVDVQGLDDREFSCAVWRAGDAARDAGAMTGGGGGGAMSPCFAADKMLGLPTVLAAAACELHVNLDVKTHVVKGGGEGGAC